MTVILTRIREIQSDSFEVRLICMSTHLTIMPVVLSTALGRVAENIPTGRNDTHDSEGIVWRLAQRGDDLFIGFRKGVIVKLIYRNPANRLAGAWLCPAACVAAVEG